MLRLFKTIVYFAVAILLLLQEDTDGTLIVEGFKGIALVAILAVAAAIYQLACIIIAEPEPYEEPDYNDDYHPDFDNLHRSSRFASLKPFDPGWEHENN
jgi:hypothetical protein